MRDLNITLRIDIKPAAEALSQYTKHVKEAQATTTNLTNVLTSVFFSVQGLKSAYQALIGSLSDYVREANRVIQAQLGLQTYAKIKGIEGIEEAIKELELVREGLISFGDAAKAIQNFMQTGFNLEQSIELLQRFADFAAFGRQSGYSFAEAIVSASEGLKNMNPILLDNVGLTKNLSTMFKEMGLSIDDLQRVQTDANIRLALYNKILQESLIVQGNYNKLLNSSIAPQIKFESAIKELKASLGILIIEGINPIIHVLNNFLEVIKNSPNYLKTFVLGLAMLSTAFMAFNNVMGSSGLLIGLILTSFVSFINAVKEGKYVVAGLIGGFTGFISVLLVLKTNVLVTTQSVKSLVSSLQTLNIVLLKNPYVIVIGAVLGLASAYLTLKSSIAAAKESVTSLEEQVKNLELEFSKANKKKLEWEVKDAEKQIQKLSNEIENLQAKLKETEKTPVLAGSFVYYREEPKIKSEERKRIEEEIKSKQQQLELERQRLSIAQRYLNLNNQTTFSIVNQNEMIDKQIRILETKFKLGLINKEQFLSELDKISSLLQSSQVEDKLELLLRVKILKESLLKEAKELENEMDKIRIETIESETEREIQRIEFEFEQRKEKLNEQLKNKLITEEQYNKYIQVLENNRKIQIQKVQEELLEKRKQAEYELRRLQIELIGDEYERKIQLINQEYERKKEQIKKEINDEKIKNEFLLLIEKKRIEEIANYEFDIMRSGLEIEFDKQREIENIHERRINQLKQEFIEKYKSIEQTGQESELLKLRSEMIQKLRAEYRLLYSELFLYEMQYETMLAGLKSLLSHIANHVERVFARAFNGINSLFEIVVSNMISTMISKLTEAAVMDLLFFVFGIGNPGGLLAGLARILGLQQGGVITKPTLAVVGEAGPEAVIPLEKFFYINRFIQQIPIKLDLNAKVSGEIIGEGRKLKALTKKIERIEKKFR